MIKSESNLSGIGVASIAKNTGYLIGTSGINVIVRFVYALALAHYLGPELYGLLNYGISWYLAFLSITGLGIAIILSREIGRDRNNGPRIVSLTLTVRIFITIIAALACGILGWFFESNAEARSLLLMFTLALIGRSFTIWTESVFTGYEENRFTFRLQAIFRTLEVVVGTTVLFIGYGVTAIATVHAISWWLQAVSGIILARRYLVAVRLNLAWNGIKHILISGLPLGLGVIMIQWLQSGTIVLYRHMASSEYSLGQLALAMQTFIIISSIPMAAGIASLPVLSRSIERRDGKDLLFSATMMKASIILGAAFGLAGLGLGPWLVDAIFGIRYVEAGKLLGLAIWLSIPFSCGGSLTKVYLARDQFFLPTICAGAGALGLTLTIPWFVSVMDTSGAILAAGTGMGVWAISLIWMLARSGDLDVVQTVFKPLFVVVIALGTFIVLKTVSIVLAVLASWTVLFSGVFLFSILTKDERYLLGVLKKKWFPSRSGKIDSVISHVKDHQK